MAPDGALTNRSLYATLVHEAEPVPLRVLVYADGRGRVPFEEWKRSLDKRTRGRVEFRIDRLTLGQWGDWRAVGDGVVELRIHHGPGLRVYVGRQGLQAVVLLGGGDKGSQENDIRKAKERWADHRARSSETFDRL